MTAILSKSVILGTLQDGSSALLDIDRVLGTHLCIQGNSGAGKSRTIRKILEITYGAMQHIVLDVEDEFYTLREKLPYLIAGGDTGDCPATIANAGELALTCLRHGLSAIIQINSLPLKDRRTFIRVFLEAVVGAPRDLWHPVLVVLDEASKYAPEKGKAESSEAVIALTDQGRKRGFTAILATHRFASIDKDATASVNNWLLGRVGQSIDRKSGADALGFAQSSPEARGLTSLDPGMYWGFGPAISPTPTLIHIGDVETTHILPGQARVPTPPAPEAMKEILAALAQAASAGAVQAAAADGSPTPTIVTPDPQALVAAEQRGFVRGKKESWRTGYAEGRVATAGAISKRLRPFLEAIETISAGGVVDDEPDMNLPIEPILVGTVAAVSDVRFADIPVDEIEAVDIQTETEIGFDGAAATPSAGSLKMIDALVICHPWPISAVLWGAFCGRSPISGPWHTAVRELKAAGLIEANTGSFLATPKAIAESKATPANIRSDVDLWRHWRGTIASLIGSSAIELLKILAQHRPHALTARQWGLLAKRSPISGPWHTAIRILKKWDCIEAGAAFSMTEKGIQIAGVKGGADTRAALHAARHEKLSSTAARIYAVLPGARKELGKTLGMSPISGPWHTAIRELLASGLAAERGGIIDKIEESLS